MNNNIKVFLCDDTLSSRLGIKTMIQNLIDQYNEPFEFVGEARDQRHLMLQLEKMDENKRPDVLLCDITYGRTIAGREAGFAIAKEINRLYPQIGVVLYSTYAYAENAVPTDIKAIGPIPGETLNLETLPKFIVEAAQGIYDTRENMDEGEFEYMRTAREAAKGFTDAFLFANDNSRNPAVQKRNAEKRLLEVEKVKLNKVLGTPQHFSERGDKNVWDRNVRLLLLFLKNRDYDMKNYIEDTCSVRIQFLD